MSIRECEDGRVLVHDFGGCEARDVLAALGLDWQAVMPPSREREHFSPHKPRIPAADLLEVIDLEALTVALIAEDFAARGSVSDVDCGVLRQCVARIGRARDHARGRAA
ncbi:MAG: hypothetical protein ACRDK4_10380 [Solirubrobacteraceae bacterium]